MGAAQRILIVDDEPSNRILAERILKGAGYVVVGASSAAAALRAIQTGPFDLYVLDLMMPKTKGTALAGTIRQRDPDARVLYYTGYPNGLFDSADAKLLDNETYLQKPVSVGQLRDAVTAALVGHTRGG